MRSIVLVNIIILALSALSSGRAPPKKHLLECGKHQQYSRLAQPCEKSCENAFTHYLAKCKAEPGCECEEGYIRDEPHGENCIKPSECNVSVVRCPLNKQYNKCKHQETTCNGSIDHDGKPGCYCKSGTYQNSQGECVKYQDCS